MGRIIREAENLNQSKFHFSFLASPVFINRIKLRANNKNDLINIKKQFKLLKAKNVKYLKLTEILSLEDCSNWRQINMLL